jgi:hypothetical protein
MKNLLIYTGPNKKFDQEHEVLARIQIDNSLDLGWKREDILLATNFPYLYNGVSSLLVPDKLYYEFDLAASKLPVVIYLIKQGFIGADELCWCHDFDAYELNSISEAELGLDDFDLGLVPYFYKPQWQFCSFFFKKSAKDVFELLDRTIRARPYASRNNEKTLTRLIGEDVIKADRYKKLNVTYGIAKRCLATVYREASKPLKVLHFLPSNYDKLMPDTALNMFMYGKNNLKMPLMNERLTKIFKYHGIK